MLGKRLKGRTGGFIVGGALVLLVFAYLLWGGIGQNLVYFLTPAELQARGTTAVGSSVRLGGMVQPGSVKWDPFKRELRFRLADGQHGIDVLSVGAPPQMFTEGIGVVVEGAMAADGSFHSHNVMVKHSNEYRAPAHAEDKAAYYRQLFKKQAS